MIKLDEGMWVSYLHVVKVVAGVDVSWVRLSDGEEFMIKRDAKEIISELTEWLTL